MNGIIGNEEREMYRRGFKGKCIITNSDCQESGTPKHVLCHSTPSLSLICYWLPSHDYNVTNITVLSEDSVSKKGINV
jgi:hypothetical protein